MIGNYKLSSTAESDLYRIWLHGVQVHGEAQADRYFTAFFDRFEQLAEQPLSYPSVDFIREGYRPSVCGVDSIYYRLNGNTIEIMSILGRPDTDTVL